MCLPTFSTENDLMQPGVTQTAAAARRIPNHIPDFPSDIPAQCGGNVQRRGKVKWGDKAERSNLVLGGLTLHQTR